MIQSPLTDSEKTRFDRQIRLPEIGEAGQIRLKAARVLVVGLGGLGSVAAYYLAAAGVGRLRIVDQDRVALENLNRQILYSESDLGRHKATTAATRLSSLNPGCRVEAVTAAIDADSGVRLAVGADMIVDATDNLAARHHLNRAAVMQGLPLAFGGVEGFDGTCTTVIPGHTACLECLFPARRKPPAPSSAHPGVVGPAAGIVASIQAMETLRVLVGLPAALEGILLTIRGADLCFRSLHVKRFEGCAVCGSAAVGAALPQGIRA